MSFTVESPKLNLIQTLCDKAPGDSRSEKWVFVKGLMRILNNLSDIHRDQPFDLSSYTIGLKNRPDFNHIDLDQSLAVLQKSGVIIEVNGFACLDPKVSHQLAKVGARTK